MLAGAHTPSRDSTAVLSPLLLWGAAAFVATDDARRHYSIGSFRATTPRGGGGRGVCR